MRKLVNLYKNDKIGFTYLEPAIAVYLLSLMYFLVVICKIIPEREYTAAAIISSQVFALMLFINGILFLKLRLKAAELNIYQTCDIYLNEFRVWEIFATGCLTRLGRYIGHGLCYEAAALEMFAWADKHQTRIVFGRAYSDLAKGHVRHAWFEVKLFGFWWAIDPTWRWPACPELRIIYDIEHGILDRQIMSHDKFWSYEASKEILEKLRKPETSHLLGELSLYRKKESGELVINDEEFSTPNFDGIEISPMTLAIYYVDDTHPVTNRIFREFAIKENREAPKAHSKRKALALQKTIMSAHNEAKALYQETNQKHTVIIKDLKSYEIKPAPAT